jgi:hypothetical protein
MQVIDCARPLERDNAGSSRPARIAMMAMTTRSSTRVKAGELWIADCGLRIGQREAQGAICDDGDETARTVFLGILFWICGVTGQGNHGEPDDFDVNTGGRGCKGDLQVNLRRRLSRWQICGNARGSLRINLFEGGECGHP